MTPIYIFFLVTSTIFLSNIILNIRYSSFKKGSTKIKEKSISVIIPARNEGKYIYITITSLLNYDKANQILEVLVGNDHSTDNTREEVLKIKDSKVKIYDIPTLEEGWKGKPWTQNYLISKAKGQYILLLDGDTSIKQDIFRKLPIDEYDLISVFPYQVSNNLLVEALANAYLRYWPISIIPLELLQKNNNIYGAYSIGQFILGRGKVLNSQLIQSVKNDIVEDIGITRSVISRNGKFKTYISNSKDITSMSYPDLKTAVNNFSRSFYLLAGNNVGFTMNLLTILFHLMPYLLIYASPLYIIPIILQFVGYLVSQKELNTKILLGAFLLPLSLCIIVGIAIKSYINNIKNEYVWKDRKYN